MRLRRLIPLAIALAMGGAVAALRLADFRPAQALELRAFDARLAQRGHQAPGDDVVVVAVDDASLHALGRWPWSRARVAELLARIDAGAPRVIGVDLVQAEPTAACALDDLGAGLAPACRDALQDALDQAQGDDARLAEVVRTSGRIVLGYFFDFRVRDVESPYRGESAYPLVQRAPGAVEGAVPRGRFVTQNLPPLAQAAAGLGYFNFAPDGDGLLRRALLAVRFHDRVVLPLSLAMLQHVWPERPPAIRFGPEGVAGIRLGDQALPVDHRGRLLVDYRGPGRTFPHVSAAELLAGRVPPEIFRDKLVVVGVSAVGAGDVRATPFDEVYPGVEIHATVLDNILRGTFIRQPASSGPDLLAILGLALLLGVALQFTRGLTSALLTAAAIAAYLVLSQGLFERAGVALAAAYPSLAAALTYVAVSVQQYVTVDREHRRTRRMLEVYLSPALARYVSERPEMLRLGGEKRDRTVLFSDLAGFTKMSEHLPPERLVELLNGYLGDMTDCVFAADGMLDKYIGDGVMAVWGAPVAQPDHAARACRTALVMVEHLAALNVRNIAQGWPTLRVRIGLNSGPMVFGNIGSPGHLSLTVMGDNVNLAARLEGISKLYGSTIIASEATIAAARDGFVARELDRVQVRGREGTVRIYELLDDAARAAAWQPLLDRFAAGLAAYRARDWAAAATAFEAALALRPDDGPAAYYLRRCRELAANPPPAGWQAVTNFDDVH